MPTNRSLIALCIAAVAGLSGCSGGAGHSVTSAEVPVVVIAQTITNRTPLPPTVATTAGTYDTVAWMSDQTYNDGAPSSVNAGISNSSPIRLVVDPASHTFTISALLPEGETQRSYIGSSAAALHSSIATNQFYADFGYNIEFYYSFSNGTKSEALYQDIDKFVADYSVGANAVTRRLQTSPTTFETSSFRTEMGLSCVSLGEWLLDDFAIDGSVTKRTRSRSAELVYGSRTSPSDIPVTGKASYRDSTGELELDADFDSKAISAKLDHPAMVFDYGEDGKSVEVGIKAAGSSSITRAADFAIPLAGTSITPDIEGKRPDVIEPVTGSFTGAFFGPKAVEAGGFAEIVRPNGARLWSGVPFLLEQK